MTTTDTAFFYGSFTHDPNSVAFTHINRTIIRGETQRAHLMRVQWGLKGKLVSVNSGDIPARLQTMQTAYMLNQVNVSAGMNNTAFTLNGQSALGGVRVTSPVSHEEIMGAEGVTYLRYTIGLEADFMIAKGLDVLSFSESLSFTDNLGSPIYIERIPVTGPPILQQVTQTSWFFATQNGKGSQAGGWPNPTNPIFPVNYLRTASNAGRTVTYNSPKMIVGNPVEYTTSWKYEFISPTPLIAWPNMIG